CIQGAVRRVPVAQCARRASERFATPNARPPTIGGRGAEFLRSLLRSGRKRRLAARYGIRPGDHGARASILADRRPRKRIFAPLRKRTPAAYGSCRSRRGTVGKPPVLAADRAFAAGTPGRRKASRNGLYGLLNQWPDQRKRKGPAGGCPGAA